MTNICNTEVFKPRQIEGKSYSMPVFQRRTGRMVKLLKRYKTEIDPSPGQIQQIHRTLGVCRYVYNTYLSQNIEAHKNGEKFISGMDFSKWLNGSIKEHPELSWIKEVSSKSVKKSIMDCEGAFKKFFKGLALFPQFKSKRRSDVKMYFVKTDAKTVIRCDRHRIKIPTLGWVRLKEKGYIPTNSETHIIKSGTVSRHAGRYYVSVLVEEPDIEKPDLTGEGLGIDLGVKDLASVSTGRKFPNINKTKRVRDLEKRLKREQRRLSRKYEMLKRQPKTLKGEATRQNIQKQVQKVQRLYQRLDNIRTDYINQCVSEIVKTKPSYITMEDLNVRGMLKNRHLSKAVANQKFKAMGIELRIADRFYPSSKTCHQCGYIKTDLNLSDREYLCPVCGYHADRDYNASLNLRDTEVYKVA